MPFFAGLALAIDLGDELLQFWVDGLGFAFYLIFAVDIKTDSGFLAKHLGLDHLFEQRRWAKPGTILLVQKGVDVGANIDTSEIKEGKWAHG